MYLQSSKREIVESLSTKITKGWGYDKELVRPQHLLEITFYLFLLHILRVFFFELNFVIGVNVEASNRKIK
jgi:hypothetical protein